MATTNRRKHLTGFKDSDHDILVKIVKAAQWMHVRGKQGAWIDFVGIVNRKKGGSHWDPAKHPVNVLAAFVQTFTKKEDVELVRRIRHWGTQRANEKLLSETNPFPLSPEQELVEWTHSHPRFWSLYNFQSWNEGWKSEKRGDANSPVRLISLDCEMVICEGEAKEVVRVCAVGSECNTLLDELVQPNGSVKDYLTSITGVSKKDLEGVSLTQADAQKLVLSLLTPGTILVGHSLYHDLRALKIDYKRVIDTSLLFRDPSWPVSYFPGLSSLCQAALNYNFRAKDKPHNCLDDAIIPMRLVHYRLDNVDSTLSLPLPIKEMNQEDCSKLLLHSLPSSVDVPLLRSIFSKDSAPQIQDIVSKNRGRTGSTVAIFPSIEEADDAFDLLEGVLSKDSVGYPQKTVVLIYQQGNRVRRAEFQVRKMVKSRILMVPDEESDDMEDLRLVQSSRKRALATEVENSDVETHKRRNLHKSGVVESRTLNSAHNSDENKPSSILFVADEQPGFNKSLAEIIHEHETEEGEVNKDQEIEEREISCTEYIDAQLEQTEKKCSCTHFQELGSTKLETQQGSRGVEV